MAGRSRVRRGRAPARRPGRGRAGTTPLSAAALLLFEALCDASPADVDARLAGVAPEVAAHVRRMLAADTRGFTAVARSGVAAELAVPTRVGGFRLLSELGRGGMGVVWLAEQAAPSRRVAVKLLHPWLDTPSGVGRFQEEVRILDALGHRGVPFVLATGRDGGAFWFAMEWVRGPSLSEVAATASPDDRLDLLRDVTDVVARAHALGIAHLDLKPTNVRVAEDGVRVLDFGIARVAGAAGITAGTPGYMAPEQAAGEAVDLRSDVYALGRIGAYLDLRGGDVARVLSRATEEDAARRYPDAGALAAALRHVGGRAGRVRRWWHRVRASWFAATERGPRVVAAPPPPEPASALLHDTAVRANPREGELAALLASAAAAAERGVLIKDPEGELRLRLALMSAFGSGDDLAQLRRQIEAASALIPLCSDALLAAEVHLGVAAGLRRLGQADDAEASLARADALLPAGHRLREDLAFTRGQLALGRGDWEGALAGFTPMAQRDPPDLKALAMVAKALTMSRRLDEAQEATDRLLAARIARQGEHHPDVAVAWSAVGQLAYERLDYPRALVAFRREVEILGATLGPENTRTASGHKWLAGTLLALDQLDEALTHARHAARVQEGDPYGGLAVQTLARVHLRRGELDDALREAERSHRLVVDRLGEDHVQAVVGAALRGEVHAARGEAASAVALLDRTVPLLIERFGAESARVRRLVAARERIASAREPRSAQ